MTSSLRHRVLVFTLGALAVLAIDAVALTAAVGVVHWWLKVRT